MESNTNVFETVTKNNVGIVHVKYKKEEKDGEENGGFHCLLHGEFLQKTYHLHRLDGLSCLRKYFKKSISQVTPTLPLMVPRTSPVGTSIV